MEAIFPYFLMLQKCISSKKKKDSEINKVLSVHYNAVDTNDILMFINI